MKGCKCVGCRNKKKEGDHFWRKVMFSTMVVIAPIIMVCFTSRTDLFSLMLLQTSVVVSVLGLMVEMAGDKK